MQKIEVTENGTLFAYGYRDIMRYHGTGFPGGAACAFRAMERVFPLLDHGTPPERREISIVTAFTGIGGRDAFEMVTRCVTDGRYHVDPELPEAENAEESPCGHYYFRFSYRGKEIVATLRPEFGHEEFNRISRKAAKTPEDEQTLAKMRMAIARCMMKAQAEEIYDVTEL